MLRLLANYSEFKVAKIRRDNTDDAQMEAGEDEDEDEDKDKDEWEDEDEDVVMTMLAGSSSS